MPLISPITSPPAARAFSSELGIGSREENVKNESWNPGSIAPHK
jgi:hypothetical protein